MTPRTNARIAGATFLLYIAVGIGQMVLARSTQGGTAAERLALYARQAQDVRINVLLTVLVCAIAVALAVALFGLVRDVDRDLAVLALSFRLGEGLLAAAATIPALGVLWLATSAAAGEGGPDTAAAETLAAFLFRVRGWNVTIMAMLFAFGSTIYAWLFLRGRLVPTWLAWLGVGSSVLLAVLLPLRLAGFAPDAIAQAAWAPMALFEIALALWLLVRGVAVPANVGG